MDKHSDLNPGKPDPEGTLDMTQPAEAAEPAGDRHFATISNTGDSQSPMHLGEAMHIEGYQITGKLGEGGMGTVWRAVQLGTRREVAIKLLGSGIFGSSKARTRFEREIELAARLEHPNIARVYESGLHHNVHYYAMELIDGVHLDEYVETNDLSPRQILDLVKTIAEAIKYAHQRGVIHRDLKPSNILVTGDGKPCVLDFGLAKPSSEDDAVTISVLGDVVGTPAYMSPEQAAGHTDQIDTRTDVYSLGVILYRLLTRQYPHELSGTRYEVLRRIAEEEIKRPRDVSKKIDKELEALLLKALAHESADRYASAGDLAKDISNYLTGEPLIARPPTMTYFLRKRMVKHRWPLTVAAGLLLAALLITILAVVFHIRSIRAEQVLTAQERDMAGQMRARADNQRNLAISTFKGLVYEVQPILASESAPLKLRRELVDLVIGKLTGITDNVGSNDVEIDKLVATIRLTSGHISRYSGDSQAARDEYSEALTISKALARLNPNSFGSQRDLVIASFTMGEFEQLTGHEEQAVKHLKCAMKIVDELDVKFPLKSELLLGDRWVLQIAMGDVAMASGNPEAALQRFTEAMELVASLREHDPISRERGLQLSKTYRRLGKAQFALENSSGARECYQKALALDMSRAKAAPRTRSPQHGISECRRQLAAIELSAGDPALAREHCRLARRSAEWLAAQDPDRISGWGDLAEALYVSGQVETAMEDRDAAASFHRKCVEILKQIDEKNKLKSWPAYLNLFDKARRALELEGAAASRPAQSNFRRDDTP